MNHLLTLVLLLNLLVINESLTQTNIKKGDIKGIVVIDSETKTSLPGTNIVVKGTHYGDAVDYWLEYEF